MQNDVLAKTSKRQRVYMAIKGEHIEELVDLNEPEVLAELIKNGYSVRLCSRWTFQIKLRRLGATQQTLCTQTHRRNLP